MRDAKQFAEALCYCGNPIPREFLKEYYESKWAKLLMKEAGIESVFIGSDIEKIKKFDCCECDKGIDLNKIRVMACGDKYCVKCLKKLMRNSIRRNKGKVMCVMCKEELDDETLKDIDKDLHDRYLFALANNT